MMNIRFSAIAYSHKLYPIEGLMLLKQLNPDVLDSNVTVYAEADPTQAHTTNPQPMYFFTDHPFKITDKPSETENHASRQKALMKAFDQKMGEAKEVKQKVAAVAQYRRALSALIQTAQNKGNLHNLDEFVKDK